MAALARGQASDCSNPILDISTTVQGILTDVAVLQYQIFEIASGETPVQVYPPSGRATALVGTLCTVGGHKLATGRYVATFTPSLTEVIGTHFIRWFFKLTLASPEQTFREDFEVLPEVTGATSDGYTTIQSLRDEGVTLAMASDTRLQKLITLCSQRFENWTGRFFEPRTRTLLFDGRGSHALMFDIPIIRLDRVLLLYSDFRVTSDNEIELAGLRVYNRHISQGLLQPDDRENPRVEWGTSPGYGEWPRGFQNISIGGIFGYTDPDGTAFGRTPAEVSRAVEMMVVKELPLIGNVDARWTAGRRQRVSSMTTRDQTISWAGASGTQVLGAFTGDPEIDNIIAQYCRPPSMGSA